MDTKVKWDIRFLQLASMVASWSKDTKRKVGCVIVDTNKRIISTGYNGLPTQLDNIKHVPNSLKNELTIHSEVNCISNLREELDALSLGPITVYITYPPCEHCAKMLTANLNVQRVVWIERKESTDSKWSDSMHNALSHLKIGCGVEIDVYNSKDIEE